MVGRSFLANNYYQLVSFMQNWMTLDELAGYLKMSRSTLYKMVQQGRLPASKVGRSWRFEMQTIDTWIQARRSQIDNKERIFNKLDSNSGTNSLNDDLPPSPHNFANLFILKGFGLAAWAAHRAMGGSLTLFIKVTTTITQYSVLEEWFERVRDCLMSDRVSMPPPVVIIDPLMSERQPALRALLEGEWHYV